MVQQKVDCILWLAELKSITCVRRQATTPFRRHLKETGNAVNQKLMGVQGHPTKMSSILDERFYVVHGSWFAQQANNCIFPIPQFMTLHTYIYMCRNCSCGSTSNQLTITAETDFVNKCCRKLHLNRINTRYCNISDSQPPQKINEHHRDKSYVNKWCGMMEVHITGPSFFQEATVRSHLYTNMLEYYMVTQLPCDAWSQNHEVPAYFPNM
jgi:hypothetical protein